MKEKFKQAVFFMSIPALVNTAGAVYCHFNFDHSKFTGYVAGTLLSIIFSILWLWMAKRVYESNPFKLFTISLGLFPVKLFVFMFAAFGALFMLKMDKFYFGFSFMLGTFLTLLVEVKFTVDINRLYRLNKKIKSDEK